MAPELASTRKGQRVAVLAAEGTHDATPNVRTSRMLVSFAKTLPTVAPLAVYSATSRLYWDVAVPPSVVVKNGGLFESITLIVRVACAVFWFESVTTNWTV
jgi:hypothetical protein